MRSIGRATLPFLLAIGSDAAMAQVEPPPRPFLRKVIGLSDAQLADIDKGQVVTKLLDTTDKVEVAAFGAVRTTGTADGLVRLARDVQRFRKVPQIPEMGVFSKPPKLADLAGLHHPPADIAALKECKPGKCDVKIGTRGLDRLAKVNWSAPGAAATASAIVNQSILDYVTAYSEGGTDAMGDVLDKKVPKLRSEEYRTLLAHSPYLVEYVKEFADYLASYPKGKLDGTEDILYWTQDNFGLKPVISAYHMTIYKGPRGVLIANKGLGASHYFNASLEILAGVPTPDGQGLYLVSLFRTRLDPPTGMLAGILMGKIRSGVETGVAENLNTARQRLATVK